MSLSSNQKVLLDFDDIDKVKNDNTSAPPKQPNKSLEHITVAPELNPYKGTYFPSDIYNYLLPDGSKFGLFSDPYGTMTYVDVSLGRSNGRYWLEERLEVHSFPEKELKLLEFLAKHRVATRNQIHKVLFPEKQKKYVVEFLQKCRQRGIICSFSWVSPLDTPDGLKKPLIYGLTRVGAEAVEILFHTRLPDDFWFHPIKFPNNRGPSMNTFFLELVANELFSEIVRIDRLLNWERKPQIRLENGKSFYPAASFEVIKDAGEFRTFWLEIFRVDKDWLSRVKTRFSRIQQALDNVPPYQKPARLIIITDGDARIPILAKLAEELIPDIQCRFTNDERLLKGLNKETFISWNSEKEQMTLSSIPFLQEGYEGVTASEYLSQQQPNVELDDEFYEDVLDYEE